MLIDETYRLFVCASVWEYIWELVPGYVYMHFMCTRMGSRKEYRYALVFVKAFGFIATHGEQLSNLNYVGHLIRNTLCKHLHSFINYLDFFFYFYYYCNKVSYQFNKIF